MTEGIVTMARLPDTPPTRGRLPVVELSGVRIHAVTEAQTVDHVLSALEAGRGGWVITPNLDHLRRAKRDATFADYLRKADLVVADGMPLVWASRLQGTPLPERVPGSTLVRTLASAAAREGRSLYLLGGAPGAAEEAARVLQDDHPDLKLAGHYCPPYGFEKDEREMQKIRGQLIAAAPDIIYVALGSPKQEWLIAQLRPLLPGAWWLGVGISLSFIAEHVRRAPRWVQRIGLEWAHRLMQEPRRLAKRYLVEGIPFAVLLLGSAMNSRQRRERERR